MRIVIARGYGGADETTILEFGPDPDDKLSPVHFRQAFQRRARCDSTVK